MEELVVTPEARVEGWRDTMLEAVEIAAAVRGQQYMAVRATLDTAWFAVCTRRGYAIEAAPRTRRTATLSMLEGEVWLFKQLAVGL